MQGVRAGVGVGTLNVEAGSLEEVFMPGDFVAGMGDGVGVPEEELDKKPPVRGPAENVGEDVGVELVAIAGYTDEDVIVEFETGAGPV